MTKDQKIDKKLAGCLKVADLKKLLERLPDDTPIGRVGHFGEFCPMDEFSFSVCEAFVTAEEWFDDHRRSITVMDICPPDIGPEPI
jgi:hypothetical protein